MSQPGVRRAGAYGLVCEVVQQLMVVWDPDSIDLGCKLLSYPLGIHPYAVVLELLQDFSQAMEWFAVHDYQHSLPTAELILSFSSGFSSADPAQDLIARNPYCPFVRTIIRTLVTIATAGPYCRI
jgi:hypothetical protein